jgi:hypothetical protein
VPPGFRRFFYILPKEIPLLWKKTHLFSIAFLNGSCYYSNARFCGQIFIFVYTLYSELPQSAAQDRFAPRKPPRQSGFSKAH